MRSFLLMTSIGCSIDASLQELRLEEGNVTSKTEKIRVEQESEVGIVFRDNDSDKIVYFTIELMAKLDALKKEVSSKFGDERWNKLISLRLEKSEVQETTECIKRLLFGRKIDNSTVCDGLQELCLFESINSVSDKAPLASTVQLAVDLGYTRVDELCDNVINRIKGICQLIHTFLDINSTKQDEHSNKDVESSVINFVKSISADNSALKEKYANMKKKNTVTWRIDSKALKILFTRNRIINEKQFSVFSYEKKSNFVGYKTLLRLRVIDYPEEEVLYKDVILTFYTAEEYNKSSIEDSVAEATIVDVVFNRNDAANKNILKCNWHKLILSKELDVSSVFYEDRDRQVDVLKIGWFTQTHAISSTKNKIVVRKYLTIYRVKGIIDFIDTEQVEEVKIHYVEAIRFCRNKKKQVFENTKVLTLEESNLGILLHDDGTLLFPNLEKLVIESCRITSDVYKILTESIRFVRIKNCIFEQDVTLDSIRAQARCKNILIQSNRYKIVLTASTGKESQGELEENTRVSRMQSTELYLWDIAETMRKNLEGYKNTKEKLRTSAVKIDKDCILYVNTMISMEREIVLLKVDRIEHYIMLKKVCKLALLRYLEVSSLDYKKENIGTLKIEKHKLDVLVVFNVEENESEALVKRLFDNRLACLDMKFYGKIETKKELLGYFVELRVLSINIEGKVTYEDYIEVIKRIHKHDKLEVLEIRCAMWDNSYKDYVNSYELAESTLEKCKRIKRLVMVVYWYYAEKYKGLRPVTSTEDGRKYKTRMEFCRSRRNVCDRARKEVTLIDCEVQEMLYRQYLVEEELKNSSFYATKYLEVTYELMV